MKIYYVADVEMNRHSAPAIHVDEICKRLGAKLYVPKADFSASYMISFIPTFLIQSLSYQFFLFIKLGWDIVFDRPNIIYTRHGHLLFVPVLLGILFHIPIVLEVNGWMASDANFNKGFISSFFTKIGVFKTLESFNFSFCWGIIAVTDGLKKLLIETYDIAPEKITVIANGVNADLLRPMKGAKEALGLSPDKLYVGYLGSFHAWQGLEYVLQAATMVDVNFIFVGVGKERIAIEQKIKEFNLENRVQIIPPVSHDQVALYINAFDICLSYPIKTRGGETSPFKIYEYLSCGKAVIASDITGMRKEFGETIYYVSPEDPTKLAIAIRDLVTQKDKRESLGKEGRIFIEKSHTWDAVAKTILDILVIPAPIPSEV